VRWSQPADEALAGLSVTATVSPDARASALRWKLRVDNTSTNWGVWRVVFPQVALADLGTNAAVLFPRGPGELQRGVWDRPFSFHGNYPGGDCSMQFMAAYREGEKPTGLYVAVHDPWGGTKDLAMRSDPATHTVRLSFDHPAPNMGLAGSRLRARRRGRLAAPARRLVRCGDDLQGMGAAEAKWWPRLARDGRTDTPRWMRDLNAWAMSGGAPAECVPGGKAVPRVPWRADRLSLV
jgi:hypothetical protein